MNIFSFDTDITIPSAIWTTKIDRHIRPATADDAPQITPLFYQIWEDMGLPLPTIASSRYGQAMETGIKENRGRFGYSHVLVYESEHGIVLGATATFYGKDEKRLTAETLQCLTAANIPVDNFLLDQESKPGEYYLDSICVQKHSRGQGVGSALLRCHQFLTAYRQSPLTLNVDKINDGACALYQRLGFEPFGTCILAGHDYDRMRYLPSQAQENFSIDPLS